MELNLTAIPSKEIMPGLHFKLIHSEKMTVSFVHIEEGSKLPEHSHPHEQITIVQKGILRLTLEGKEHKLEPGSVLIIPSNSLHSAVAETPCEVIDVFSPVREDYKQ